MSNRPPPERAPNVASATLAVAPGSAAAIAVGCNCPIYDNAHGKGWLCSGLFILRDDCPIHGTTAPSQPDREHAGQWPTSPNVEDTREAKKTQETKDNL